MQMSFQIKDNSGFLGMEGQNAFLQIPFNNLDQTTLKAACVLVSNRSGRGLHGNAPLGPLWEES